MDWRQGRFDFGARAGPPPPMSVGDFTRRLRGAIESSFGKVSVRGQISNLSRPQSGHLYFSLVDDEGTASRFSSAQLPAVLWRSTVARLRFRPQNGMKVVVTGSVALYEPRGVYQLVGDRVIPEGVGELQLAFEELRDRLAAEGLFEDERKRPLPYLPRRIGIVTSPSGAALHDFLRIVTRRQSRIWVRVAGVRVQGAGAADEIARAIDSVGRPGEVDVLVLARGGGSLEDLWAFNEEVVARALHRCRVPTVSAIGHEVDFTIADFVADHRAATPTAAASAVIPDGQELGLRLDGLRRRLGLGLRAASHDGEVALERLASSRRLRDPQLIVEERLEALDDARAALENHLYKRLDRWDDSLFRLATKLDGLSPFAVLERGYSVTLDGDGRPVRSASQLAPGQQVRLRFRSGEARARIEEVEPGGLGEPRSP